MDILIPLAQSDHDYIELKYALRSAEKHLNPGNMFIIGQRPKWLKNVIHIPFKERFGNYYKSYNICRKIFLTCDDKRLSDDFLFMNDDHFLLSNFTGYHYKGRIEETMSGFPPIQPYYSTLQNTLRYLSAKDLPTKDFDTHCPIIYNKERFKATFESIVFPGYGYGIKSLYCNLNGISGDFYPDYKIVQPLLKDQILSKINGRPYFSTSERGVNAALIEVWDEVYPVKSIYEVEV